MPRLVKAALGMPVDRPPAWMMRQAGRYQKAYRNLSKKHPGFRERSETTDLIVEISLQPWHSFKPDGIILFSDILTPLNAMGIPFEIDETKGPLIMDPVRSLEDVRRLCRIDFEALTFVGDALKTLRKEVRSAASAKNAGGNGVSDDPAVLGFVGSPWTLATYIVEGQSTSTYKTIKKMADEAPEVLHALCSNVAESIASYCCYQIEAGAQCIQIFDSWGGQLPPSQWDKLSRPYLTTIIEHVKRKHPDIPLVLYANGSGGLLERMGQTGADVIGLDWSVDMADARKRLGPNVAVQGNVDPIKLFSTEQGIADAVQECVQKAGNKGHILNLGHGVMVGTPEENVGYFFDYNRSQCSYK